MHIILFQPQIPQNTGNIVRTCSVTKTKLTLVRPLGFQVTDRWLKRAGLDYWEGVEIDFVDDLEALIDSLENPFYLFSSKAKKLYTEVQYTSDTALVFGSETSGLPQKIHEKYGEALVKIPMVEESRCLNLATSVGIGLYEAIRQVGNLHG